MLEQVAASGGMRIVFSTFGSLGDLFPYLRIGSELRRRGHHVVLATGREHRNTVERNGFEFIPTAPDCPFSDPDFQRKAFRERTGGKFLLCDSIFPQIRKSYADLLRAVEQCDVLVTQTLSFAGPIVAEITRVPWVSTMLAPMSFFSRHDSPVLAVRLRLLREHAPQLNAFVNRMARLSTRTWSDPIREFRRDLGLAPGQDPIFEGQHSPQRVLALFSRWFAEPQQDWPLQVVLTGFIYGQENLPDSAANDSVERFLNNGPAPVVFTLGSSAVLDPGAFYRESVRAVRSLGLRAVLIGATDNLTEASAPDVFRIRYAPHHEVFPRAKVIVHSPGIGTTAEAIRSGRPLLAVPWAFDQPDNAARLVRLGVARTLSRYAYTHRRAAKELGRLIHDPAYQQRCTALADGVNSEDGVGSASDEIEEAGRSTGSRPRARRVAT